jgi:DNA-binding IclR family transcriptional regulator
MRELTKATKESSHVGIRSGLECIVLDRIVGPHLFKCYVEAGARGPLHTGAPGKVMLAWLPDEELRQALDGMTLSRMTAASITDRKEFEKHLRLVRRRGYAMDLGEGVEGHHCLGAPVFDAEERPIASIWITAPASRLTEHDGKRLAPQVIDAANAVTSGLRGTV